MMFAKRGRSVWKLKSRSIALGERTRVMGVLNVTPDSFSDGGVHFDTARAIEHGLSMFADGADIVDVGGESTRPGKYEPDTAGIEQGRVLPVILGILQARPAALLSIDTYRAETARLAIEAGVEIVNDVSGFRWDDAMASTCARLRCGVVLMHTRGRPAEWKHLARLRDEEVVPLVKRELTDRLQAALDGGVLRGQIVLDPGFGFGKSYGENYPLLAGIGLLRELGQPLLAGVSQKSFLGRTLARSRDGRDAGPDASGDAPPAARGNASIAAMVAAILAGADVVRVHQVKSAVEAASVADAVLSSSAEYLS